MGAIRVMIADDHVMFREAIAHLLEAQGDIEVVGEASNGPETLLGVGELRPDVLLLDLAMPEMDGLEVLREIRKNNLDAKVLVLTGYFDEGLLFQALQEGAVGYLLKQGKSIDLLKAIRAVNDGEAWVERKMVGKFIYDVVRLLVGLVDEEKGPRLQAPLTKREEEITHLVAEGYSNKEIGAKLCIAEKTVKAHLTSIFKKLNASHRVQVAQHVLRQHASPPSSPFAE